MCIDGNTLDQLPEDGNLAQLRVIAIDSPTMDSPNQLPPYLQAALLL